MYKYFDNGNGIGCVAVAEDYTPSEGELLSFVRLTQAELEAGLPIAILYKKRQDILDEIRTLENSMTPRRIREGGQWLKDLDGKINTLRKGL
jgi:hypothetical protein